MYSADIIMQVRDATDIVRLVGESVALQKKGTHYFGHCPYHSEKTASFSVHAVKQFYHCFGCHETGDAFTFYMRQNGATFPEAIEALAQKAGIPLESYQRKKSSHEPRSREVLHAAVNYFVDNLQGESVDYLAGSRRLETSTITSWKLGFAPDKSGGLRDYLLGHGFTLEEMAREGLVQLQRTASRTSHNYHDYLDFFWKRVMIPLHDHLGKLVGFAGRALAADADIKYLNTPEESKVHGNKTLFQKRRVLFGLHRAVHAIRGQKEVFLTEGYFDVIAAQQAGIENIVAAAGTALTEEQVRLLQRFTDSVSIVMDNDTAGREGAQKAAKVVYGAGLNPQIISLPRNCKDLDDFIHAEAEPLAAFRSLPALDVIDFHLVHREIPMVSADASLQVLDEMLEYFELEPSVARKMMWMQKAAERLEIDPRIVEERFLERYDSLRHHKNGVVQQNSSVDIPALFIAHLLTVTPAYAQQFFRDIPPESPIIPPPLQEVYSLIVREYGIPGPLQMPLRFVRRQQQSLFDTAAVDAAFRYFNDKVKAGQIKRLPLSLYHAFFRFPEFDLDQCAHALRAEMKQATQRRVMEQLEDAIRAGDVAEQETLSRRLEGMLV